MLARNPQPHPARDKHLQLRTCGKERGNQRSGFDDVFEIVQHEENVLISEAALESIDNLSRAALQYTEGLRDGRDNKCRIGDRREIDEDGAIRKEWSHIARNGQRQTRLAYPARSGQGQQRHTLVEQDRPGPGALSFPANEPGARNRERAKGTRLGGSDHAVFSTEEYRSATVRVVITYTTMIKE